ncbi:MAG: hypothetical protein KF734_05400 [Saprospiraceae bacterium]|nr:hypothetical protein [Saprospiraceae bacterium]
MWGGFALPTFRPDGAGACGVGESPYRHFASMGLVRVGWFRSTDIAPRWGWCVWGGFALPILRPDGAGAYGVVSLYRYCAPMGLVRVGWVNRPTDISPRWGWCVWGGFALPTFRLDGAGACGVGESPYYRYCASMGLVRVGWVNRPTDIAPRWGWCVWGG